MHTKASEEGYMYLGTYPRPGQTFTACVTATFQPKHMPETVSSVPLLEPSLEAVAFRSIIRRVARRSRMRWAP